jgi:hypothetical protein
MLLFANSFHRAIQQTCYYTSLHVYFIMCLTKEDFETAARKTKAVRYGYEGFITKILTFFLLPRGTQSVQYEFLEFAPTCMHGWLHS